MFDKKYNELLEKANLISALGTIYTYLEDKMHWDCMKYNEPDAEHDSAWFTEYDTNDMYDSQKSLLKAYKMVLSDIEKLAK